MSQSFEIQGQIHSIGDTMEFGNNGFKKREFVIKLTGAGENSAYPNHVALELLKDNCGIMDAYQLGDEIKAHFNLSGRLWAGNGKGEKCFTSLQAWRIESVNQNAQPAQPDYGQQAMPDYDNQSQAQAQYGSQPAAPGGYATPQHQAAPAMAPPMPKGPEPATGGYAQPQPANNNFGSFDDDIPF